MEELLIRLRTRLVASILSALGVALLMAGLLTYTAPVAAGPEPSQSPTIVTAPPTVRPTFTPTPSGAPTPTPEPTPPADRVATRVVIKDLGIDLPVIDQPANVAYPLCNVAMYLKELHQPGFGGATYLYAHARAGMFLPILNASKVANGAKMIGMAVEVYTSDDQLFVYSISEVRRHQLDLDAAIAATTDQIWLQTSEGPKGTRPKTQVVGELVSSGPTDHDAAHPVAKPKVCA
ncbi:MAG: sortase [Chloroflexota bacterium]|nr:MAG: sortase [Chloroflexota bacterium]